MTTWKEKHAAAQGHAEEAQLAIRGGAPVRAVELFALAAAEEEEALRLLDDSKSRTIGITAISAAALYYKADKLGCAERVALSALIKPGLPTFAGEQLRLILQTVWHQRERNASAMTFFPGQVNVSVRGGKILTGGAPLDLIVEKVQTIQGMFYRIVEMMRGAPHRNRGAPPKEITELCKPWLFQTVPGSYQFAVAVEAPKQDDLFAKTFAGADIARKFVEVVAAAASESPEDQLPHLVESPEYRRTILRLTRNLTPTGKAFDEIEISASGIDHPVRLELHTRKSLQDCLKRIEGPGLAKGERVELRGTLRNVHLDKNWIELATDDGLQHIGKISEAVDDVIGPMVNRPVLVRATRLSNGKLQFVDIEPTD